MPYKSKNINFAKPSTTMDSDLVNDLSESLMIALQLERHPIGIRFLFNEQEYNNVDLPEPRAKISYCKMIENATRKINCKSKLEHHLCDGATTALSLENSTSEIESGEVYFSYNLYENRATARRMRSKINSLHKEKPKTYGLEIRSLNDFIEKPDIVMLFVNPYQGMRIMQGYVYKTGVKPTIDYGAMQALCSELTITPYLSGELNISLLCPSTRMLSKWSENELGVSFPFYRFNEIVDGIMATIDATDLKPKRKKIKEEFERKNKDICIDLDIGY